MYNVYMHPLSESIRGNSFKLVSFTNENTRGIKTSQSMDFQG